MKLRGILTKGQHETVSREASSVGAPANPVAPVKAGALPLEPSDLQHLLEAYDQGVRLVRSALGVQGGKSTRVEAVVEGLVRGVRAAPGASLLLACKSTASHYLIGHSVNVCVLSIAVGERAKLPREELHLLATAALVHDVGMRDMMTLVAREGGLTPEERAAMQHHVLLGSSWATEAALGEEVATIMAQHHERANGQGYPAGLTGERCHPLSRILQTVDTYEALTHPRPYRPAFLPHEAMKTLLEMAHGPFDAEVVKWMVETVSLYPPGSFVQLNTGAYGRVVEARGEFPTRPVVALLFQEEGGGGGCVDLTEQPMVHITRALALEEIPFSEDGPRLRGKLQQWWV